MLTSFIAPYDKIRGKCLLNENEKILLKKSKTREKTVEQNPKSSIKSCAVFSTEIPQKMYFKKNVFYVKNHVNN